MTTPTDQQGVGSSGRKPYGGRPHHSHCSCSYEVERLRAALTRIASIYACDDPPCRHMALADDIAVHAVLGETPPDHEPSMEPRQ